MLCIDVKRKSNILFSSCRPSLSHQRPQEDKQKLLEGVNKWYKRGIDSTKTAAKFRKGACENCGSMTHKKKDCLEVPYYLEHTHMRVFIKLNIKRMLQALRTDAHVLLFKYVHLLFNCLQCNLVVCV